VLANGAVDGTPSPPSVARSTKEQLVLAAERLFALHGIDGASLRQIGAEAGMGNNSAVQYHFGSKDRLVEAILLYRMPQLARRRRLLAARAPADRLRSVVEAHLLPVIEQAEDDAGYYLTFLEQLMGYGIGEHPFERLPAEHQALHHEYLDRVRDLLPALPEPLRTIRINQASTICLHVSADRERARRAGSGSLLPFALHVSELFDGLVGFLEAPVSDETRAALDERAARFEHRIPAP
jgi:AcrR family transcriptional regulator